MAMSKNLKQYFHKKFIMKLNAEHGVGKCTFTTKRRRFHSIFSLKQADSRLLVKNQADDIALRIV